jgi:hypothetical protein
MNNRDFLKDEYFKLQDQYEEYDSRALQIKGWIGAGSVAGLAIGLNPDNSDGGIVWILISAISACFWYLEAKWKLFQYALRGRIKLIEAYFRSGNGQLKDSDNEPAPLQIYESWFEYYDSSLRSLFWAAGQSFVHLPYSLIILICLVMYLRDILM